MFGIRPGVADMFDISRLETEQISLFEAHIRALRAYRPPPSSVPLTLVRASVQLPLSHVALDTTLGWSDLVENVRVHTVPGSHGSITTEPLVRELAKILTDELDAAHGITGPRRTDQPVIQAMAE